MLRARLVVLSFAALLAPAFAGAQGTVADYRRAMELRDKVQALPVNVPEPATWIDKTTRFWYRRLVKEGAEFVLVDASTQAKRPAFDHQRLADVLNAAIKPPKAYTAITLPFNTFSFVDGEEVIQFSVDNVLWRCRLADYTCPDDRNRGGGGGGRGGRGGGGLGGPCAPIQYQRRRTRGNRRTASSRHSSATTTSPSVNPASATVTLLSTDGSEGGYYNPDSIVWSPDSKKIAAYKVKPGLPPLRALRRVLAGRPAPAEALDAPYAKPGDVLDVETPGPLRRRDARSSSPSTTRCSRMRTTSRARWRKDSRAVTFEYNQRGHQVYRVIEIDAATGAARAVIGEEPKTFFCYSGKQLPARRRRRARKSSGCPSATAGTTSISTTAARAR